MTTTMATENILAGHDDNGPGRHGSGLLDEGAYSSKVPVMS
ncbi:hypothetical protein [Arthrobacter cavernae]|nr:hypothetical protein [Arthrobacter cavernae]